MKIYTRIYEEDGKLKDTGYGGEREEDLTVEEIGEIVDEYRRMSFFIKNTPSVKEQYGDFFSVYVT